MKYVVEFENSHGELRKIGQASSIDGCWDIISEFIEERNFKSYYNRRWIADGKMIFDVGSHTEFFHVSKDDGTEITWKDMHQEEEEDMAYRCKLNQSRECCGCQECISEPELRCSVCDTPIHEGDRYYEVNGDIYCDDCGLEEFVHYA